MFVLGGWGIRLYVQMEKKLDRIIFKTFLKANFGRFFFF